MDFAAEYRRRAQALEAYLDELFVKFEAERKRHADEHLRSVFQNFDLDDSGTIDHYEFSRVCERLNPTMSPEDIEDALSLIDADGDGDISFEEFERWWNSDHAVTLRETADAEIGKADEIDEIALVTRWETTRARLEKEKLHRAFESIDEDGSGSIEFSEFRRLCRRMNAKMSDEEIKMTFAIVDTDGSGEVDFNEFAEWWETEDGRRLRGEGGKATSSDFSLQELIEAVEARMKDRKAVCEREQFARKKRVAGQQAGWAAVRAERKSLADAKAAAIATEQRLQTAALEKLRMAQAEEKRKRLEQDEQMRRLQYEEYKAARRSTFDTTQGQTDVKVVSWLPLQATLRREPEYIANAGSLERHEAEISANLVKAPAPPLQPKLRHSGAAAGKAGKGNSIGNDQLLLLPLVDGVLKID